jgi:hypothetical protein
MSSTRLEVDGPHPPGYTSGREVTTAATTKPKAYRFSTPEQMKGFPKRIAMLFTAGYPGRVLPMGGQL